MVLTDQLPILFQYLDILGYVDDQVIIVASLQ